MSLRFGESFCRVRCLAWLHVLKFFSVLLFVVVGTQCGIGWSVPSIVELEVCLGFRGDTRSDSGEEGLMLGFVVKHVHLAVFV